MNDDIYTRLMYENYFDVCKSWNDEAYHETE